MHACHGDHAMMGASIDILISLKCTLYIAVSRAPLAVSFEMGYGIPVWDMAVYI
jgi:hypothetical protein